MNNFMRCSSSVQAFEILASIIIFLSLSSQTCSDIDTALDKTHYRPREPYQEGFSLHFFKHSRQIRYL